MDEQTLDQLLEVIKKRRIEGSIGDLDYRIDRKAVRGKLDLDNATIRAMLGYDGNMNLNAQAPLWGGQINFDANHTDNGNRFDLGYRRPIRGGDLSLDASRAEDGARRIYLQLKKQF